jgi:hypothetical protein
LAAASQRLRSDHADETRRRGKSVMPIAIQMIADQPPPSTSPISAARGPVRSRKRTGLLLTTAFMMLTAGVSVGRAADEVSQPPKELKAMSNEVRSATGEAEIAAAKAMTTKVLAIGKWTAKATPETRPAIMPSEARDTMRLQLAGKIDQWYAKSDGSGAVFLMNVTDPAEAHRLLENLPLGRADMMTFEIIPIGPLWPMGLLLREPAK